MIIIGITGTNASGKDTAADFFKQQGFEAFSLSDILREEAKKRGLEVSRENLIALGKELREKFGLGYLAEETLKKIKANSIVTSIRHPQEVATLKKSPHFSLIAVDAPIELRYKRVQKRDRGEKEGETLAEFKKLEAKEFASEGAGQQLGKCMAMAEYQIENDGTKEAFYQKLASLFNKIKNETS